MGEIAQARKDLNFMPDALNIIPSVVDEMCEEDQMEVESKHGSAQDNTLAACVQCLLQCFNPDFGKGQSHQSNQPPNKKRKRKKKEKRKKNEKKKEEKRKKEIHHKLPLASYPC
jgi:hypothetical protein